MVDGAPAYGMSQRSWVVGGGDPDEAGKPGLGQGRANPQASCSAAIGSSRKLGMASPPLAACS